MPFLVFQIFKELGTHACRTHLNIRVSRAETRPAYIYCNDRSGPKQRGGDGTLHTYTLESWPRAPTAMSARAWGRPSTYPANLNLNSTDVLMYCTASLRRARVLICSH